MILTRSPTFFTLLISLLIFISYPSYSVPKTFSFETFITINSANGKPLPLSGIYDVKFELLTEDKTVTFSKSFTAIVNLGVLTIEIEEDDELDTSVFKTNILSSRITISGSSINTI